MMNKISIIQLQQKGRTDWEPVAGNYPNKQDAIDIATSMQRDFHYRQYRVATYSLVETTPIAPPEVSHENPG